MAYTPELSLRSSCTLRRISWALGVPMTKGIESVFEFLPMVLDREKVYYAWITRSTRKDGLAFLNSVREKGEGGQPEKPRGGGKVFPLFSKSVTKTSQSIKRAYGD